MEELTYEQALKRLEDIIKILERNESTLDESITLYQEGLELTSYLEKKLKTVEDKVTMIFENNQIKEYDGENND